MSQSFKAVLISRDDDKRQSVETTALNESDLMDGDVTVGVEATTVNYKDGLAVTGKSPVVRRWPMVPGIDFAGTVLSSSHSGFSSGDAVILNGFGVGETHYGGFAEKARVSGDWLVHRPEGISAVQSMSIGTAGYTAMLSVLALERHGVTPDRGPVLVTGANGGVGTISISILSKLGYEVLAATRRPSETEFLESLGATTVLDAAEFLSPGRPLGKERWAGAIDCVGSQTLANVLAQTQYGGAVTACGLAQGYDLPATVMPFILRGVSLLGIDSVMAAKSLREDAWSRLASDLDLDKLAALTTEIGFNDLIDTAQQIIEGKIRGRVVAQI